MFPPWVSSVGLVEALASEAWPSEVHPVTFSIACGRLEFIDDASHSEVESKVV